MQTGKLTALWLAAAVVLSILPGGCGTYENAALTRTGFYFDTVIQITIYNPDKEECLDSCMELAGRYEKLLSTTVEGSDIWNINHSGGEPVEVSGETIQLLNTALYYCELTDGRIDPTIETVSGLWDFHEKSSKADETGRVSDENDGRPDDKSRVPDKEKLEEALTHVNWRNIVIDGNTVALKDPEASITLGFIAKGFIADKLKEYLLSENVESAIINLGGNLLAVGSRPDGMPFKFGVQKPFGSQGNAITSLSVSDKSLVSSGVYERYFYENGVHYHHILDTDTGKPIENNLLSVSILSGSSTEGDALSTSCFVLGLDEGMELIESLDGVEAVFITADYELHYSSGFPRQPSSYIQIKVSKALLTPSDRQACRVDRLLSLEADT